jgi:hypothetical protein
MRLLELLHSPPPVHAFAVSEDELLYARHGRQRSMLERIEHEPIGEAWHQLGPVGVLHVDRQRLGEGLAAIIGRVGGALPRASLVVPDTWARPLLLDFETIPRRREEAEEVIRWRLKRLLPCRPEDVRLDYAPVSDDGRLLVVVALDRPLLAVEETFAAAGVQLGRIEPLSLALSAFLPVGTLPVLLAAVHGRSLGLTVSVGGRPVLIRQKALPAEGASRQAYLFRELSRTVVHLRAGGRATGVLEVWLAGVDDGLADSAAEWAVGQEAVAVRRLAVGPDRMPALGEEAGGMKVWAWALLGTAWRGEAT